MKITSETGGEAVPRARALEKLEEASQRLRQAAMLIDEAAGDRAPRGLEEEHEELKVLAEEARDVYVRLRAARDILDASATSEAR